MSGITRRITGCTDVASYLSAQDSLGCPFHYRETLVGFALQLAAFYVLVSIFSDGAESRARWQIFVIALVVTLLMSIVASAMPTLLGFVLACVLAAAISLAALTLWIKVTTKQALKISGAYVGFAVAYSLLFSLVSRGISH